MKLVSVVDKRLDDLDFINKLHDLFLLFYLIGILCFCLFLIHVFM